MSKWYYPSLDAQTHRYLDAFFISTFNFQLFPPMPRIYFTNESYPELREIESRWERHKTWYRAFGSAFRDWRFWRFWGVEFILLGGWFAMDQYVISIVELTFFGESLLHGGFLTAAVLLNALLTITWGGDLMRPHLRRVSASARDACPECGHLLTGHLTDKGKMILCPECGGQIDTLIFDPPYRIPKKYLATGGIFTSSDEDTSDRSQGRLSD